LRGRCEKQPKIYRALQKYGLDNFTFELFDCASNKETLDFLEDFYIEVLDSRNNGYNTAPGGHKGHGIKGRQPWHKIGTSNYFGTHKFIGENNHMFGKENKHTEETKQKISNTLKGRISPTKGKTSPFKGIKRGPRNKTK
jgi:group I intron endonuclease